MAPKSRAGYQPRKHSKTFTGCWTCRARKVKCDESRPSCRQCCQKKVDCEGYGIRLQWIGHYAESPHDEQAPHIKSQRSQIALDVPGSILPNSRVDEILTKLDSFETAKADPVSDGFSVFIKGFGVFGRSSNAPPLRLERTSDCCGISLLSDISLDDSMSFTLPEEIFHSSPWVPLSPSSYWDEDQLLASDPTLGELTEDALTHMPGSGYRPALDLISDTEVPSPTQLAYHSETYVPGIQPSSCPNPLNLSRVEQLLMYHYTNRVVHLFCVIDNAKSPWKTIHLPKALQSAGELSVQGSTSKIRFALTNALLAISAFYLSNENRFRSRKDEASRWAVVAADFRYKAIDLLKNAVQIDLYAGPRPKYKEFLATMLSMITINVLRCFSDTVEFTPLIAIKVMSGDTNTCGVHLDGALRLINQARTWKEKYSAKAQSLHRIYFYLRTIYESTAPRGHRASQLSSLAMQEGQGSSTALDDPFCRDILLDSEPRGCSYRNPNSRMASYEYIYGVPRSLLALLVRAIELINKLYKENASSRSNHLTNLADESDELECHIMDWPLDDELKHALLSSSSARAEIIRHQTRAFHNAVIIYFAQHVRLVGYRFLQPYVKVVIESIEAIERIKMETQILAAPLYWPAFIAASEAFDDSLRDRFKCWYTQVEGYGIEAVRTGVDVLMEVWKNGSVPRKRNTSCWRAVVESSNHRLMLS